MKVKHTFVYVCVVIFAFVIINRVQSPQLDLPTKILYVLSVVGFFVLCSFLIFHLETLDARGHSIND
jgi:hypothetical protein